MPRDNYRIAAAERHRDIQNTKSRAGRAVRSAGLWTRYGARRSLDAAGSFFERLTSGKAPTTEAHGDRNPLLIVGHRGAPYRIVENTIPSCEQAVEREGANALEIDLCMTKDGHVVLWHDWDPNDTVALARQLGVEPGVKFSPIAPAVWDDLRRHVDELTLQELRTHYSYAKKFMFFFKRRCAAHIPTFDEFVSWARTRTDLKAVFLDLKVPGDRVHLVKPLVEAMQRTLDARDNPFRCVWMTPHQPVYDAIQEAAPQLSLCLDTELPPGILRNPEDYSAVKRARGIGSQVAAVGRPVLTWGGWKIYQKLVADDLANARQQSGDGDPIELLAWTFDNRSESKRMLQLGVQGILTNRPARVLRIAKKTRRELV